MARDYYREGMTVGPVKIIERLCGGDRQDEVRYLVEWTCCRERCEMTHRQIALKAARSTEMCRDCVDQKKQGNPAGAPVSRVPAPVPVVSSQKTRSMSHSDSIQRTSADWFLTMPPLGTLGHRHGPAKTAAGIRSAG